MVSVNVSSKEFLQTESTDSEELQDRVGQLRLRWDAAQGAVESWREGLRLSLMQCQVRRLSTSRCPRSSPEHSQAHVGGRRDMFIIFRLPSRSQIWFVLGSTRFTICFQSGLPAASETRRLPCISHCVAQTHRTVRVPASVPVGWKCHTNIALCLSFCQEHWVAEC